MDDRAIHLLFSANRWEAASKMEEILNSGINIVMDRYSYSGVAFSAAKPDLSLEWCWAPEIGLPKPDSVIFLDIPIEKASKRANFGEERYEKTDFQQKVYKNFYKIMALEEPKWHVLDATETIKQVHERVMEIASKCIATKSGQPVEYMTSFPQSS
jgi:dTMP kinase